MPEQRNDIRRRNNAPRPRDVNKNKKAKSRAVLIMYGVVLLGIITGAILLCVFVFFRINHIEITGTAIYSSSDIAAQLGLNEGDNLVFADTSKCEDKLQAKFPYVEKAEIVKKIPSTLEVHITEAQVYYSFVYGEQYVYVSRSGKMLEVQDQPMTGSMVVKGVDIKENSGKIEFADISKASIFQDVSAVFTERDNIGITEVNLENIHEIYVIYDGRVKMILGSAADLTYKLTFGLQIAGSIGPEEKGSLDLSHAKDINTAYFMPDISSNSEDEPGNEPSGEESGDESAGGESGNESSGNESGENSGENNESPEESGSPENGGDEGSENEGSSGSSKPERGDDIPDV